MVGSAIGGVEIFEPGVTPPQIKRADRFCRPLAKSANQVSALQLEAAC